MIDNLLFQLNFLISIALLMFCCNTKKSGYDGNRDVPLVGGGEVARSKSRSVTPMRTPTRTPPKDDFTVGTPLPNIPLADPADDNDNTLIDIESIKSEKALSRSKKMRADKQRKRISRELMMQQ